jgi:hypothetical protein
MIEEIARTSNLRDVVAQTSDSKKILHRPVTPCLRAHIPCFNSVPSIRKHLKIRKKLITHQKVLKFFVDVLKDVIEPFFT